MSNLSRLVRGRRTAALALLLSVVWLGSFAAPTSAWWGLPTRTFHAGGHLGVDSDLLSKSGLSAWAIDRYLAANTPLPPLGSAFMKAERRYGINARYLVAHAMLESGFGTSDIARYAHNLFGYHAYDRDPWRYATRFRTYAGGILGVAKAIKRDYLVPSGRFWGGAPTLRGMYMYASDPNWDRKIAAIAAGLDLPTLSELGVRLGRVAADDEVLAARRTTIRIPVDPGRAGAVPAGVRFLVRFRPLALREADPQISLVAKLPGSIRSPGFRPPLETDRGATSVGLTVLAPSWPGRYAIEVLIRDTDGALLPDANRLRIRSAVVRVAPAASVSYSVSAQAAGLVVRATNTGSVAIKAAGARNIDDGSPAALEAWSLGAGGGTAQLVRSLPLTAALNPGSVVSFTLPMTKLATANPAFLVIRLRPTGDGGRPLGTPGVFALTDVAGRATPEVDPVLPLDPASARLLGATRGRVSTVAPSAALLAALRAEAPIPGTSRSTAVVGGQQSSSAAGTSHTPKAALIVGLHLPLDGPSADGATGGDPADTGETGNYATIAIDAIPAGGAADDPLSFRGVAPLPKQLAAGSVVSGLLPVPATAAGPSSYLAIGRILVTAGGRTYTTAVQAFWLVVPGPSVSTASPSAPAAHATKPKPKSKRRTHHHRPKPNTPQYRIHIVLAGETLWGIAHRSGWSIDAIRRLNPWVDTVGIHPGDALKIPG
jgi:LysM repeat protein